MINEIEILVSMHEIPGSWFYEYIDLNLFATLYKDETRSLREITRNMWFFEIQNFLIPQKLLFHPSCLVGKWDYNWVPNKHSGKIIWFLAIFPIKYDLSMFVLKVL